MYDEAMRRLIITVLMMILALSLCGCFLLGGSTDKKLTAYHSDSPVVAVRLYYQTDRKGPDRTYAFEELPADKLDEFIKTVDSMALYMHTFHTDYFWGGSYGIEMTLEDGTYLTYDGTCLKLSKTPVDVKADAKEDKISSTFIEVKNCDFWKEMRQFFPDVEDKYLKDMVGW